MIPQSIARTVRSLRFVWVGSVTFAILLGAGIESQSTRRQVEALADTFMAKLRNYYSGRRLTQLANLLER